MPDRLRVIMAASEVTPFAKTGGLADVTWALSKELSDSGVDISIIMPLYRSVIRGGYKLARIRAGVTSRELGRLPGFDLYECKHDGVTLYFVDNRKYFDRDELYGPKSGDYEDSALRFSFFSKAVLASMKALLFRADVIHCNDWQTALIPFYLKHKLSRDGFYKDTKVLYTIHNLAYQGQFPRKYLRHIDVPWHFFHMYAFEFYTKINLMKSGIIYSDAINTVSKGYACEIMTKEHGAGLDGLLRTKAKDIYGIVNGVDYTYWNPETDKFIKENFTNVSIEKKKICKKDLIATAGLNIGEDRPLFGIVSRLAWQKGIDIFAEIIPELVRLGTGVVVLGRGEEKYERSLLELSQKYRGSVSYSMDFNEPLAHKIEAGADFFIMPSRYEPCGLNHMYSLKYGTIPIVRATGGLDDIIIDVDHDEPNGNGFKFAEPDSQELLNTVLRAIKRYEDKYFWRNLLARAMVLDYSWKKSAGEYIELYKKIICPSFRSSGTRDELPK